MAEQVEPQHGLGCAPLVGDEPDEEGDAAPMSGTRIVGRAHP